MSRQNTNLNVSGCSPIVMVLKKYSRTDLQNQCIQYLGPKDREAYEVIAESGKLVYSQSGLPVDTPGDTKWIFVLSTTMCMYVGEKKKGIFQHSSFVAGGAIITAGRLVVNSGNLQAIWNYSGHYRPSEENFTEVVNFLEERQMDLTNVTLTDDDIPPEKRYKLSRRDSLRDTHSSKATNENVDTCDTSIAKDNDGETQKTTETSLETPKIELGRSFSSKWTTEAGPRIGCVREYPTELQFQALESEDLTLPARSMLQSLLLDQSPKFHLSPRVACMGHPCPRIQTTKC